MHNYIVYILTNPSKTVLYIGMTNDLPNRLVEHYLSKGNAKTFAGKYYCYNLVHFESFSFVEDAIAREKEIKKWSRSKKEVLINTYNKGWKALNASITEWPPEEKSPNRY